jgi:CheY-like chemotaxis protein/anti-sigma regulatory factor (Ser/Thr protein kinase)
MKKILFIDDNVSLRELTLEALSLEGFDVFGAGDGKGGIAIAKEHSPDIILCDIMMPEIDGYEVYRQLKADPSTALIPFIFLTALAERDDVRKGMNLGADDYIIKPISLDELLATIYTRLNKSKILTDQLEERMNELRDRITHVIPHEFLTPLNGILGFTGILKENINSLSRPEIADIVTMIEDGGNRLHNLIRSYLSYAIVTSKEGQEIKSEKVNHIHGKIAQISKKIAKHYDRESDLILNLEETELMIEPDDFDFLIKELVDNAFKFSEAKSNVLVLSTVIEGSLEIRISDHGMGFPLESMSDIGAFNQFNRQKIEQQGSGLGLITAMLIAQRYHGSLKITNDKFGTTVILTLPVNQEFECV